jgi:predicted dinucleotide-binding enzyme
MRRDGPTPYPERNTIMRIGFIGAGTLTQTFGRHLINAGHEIIVSNSREPETLAGFIADLGPGATADTKKRVAECDIVILATNWVNVPEALKDIDWRGRILIDATNAHMDPKPDISPNGVNRSIAALNGARLVKSISNMPMAWIHDFSSHKPKTVIFTSGDDSEAKKIVIDLIDSVGFVAIDLGSLAKGGAMHQVGAPLSGLELHFVRRLR